VVRTVGSGIGIDPGRSSQLLFGSNFLPAKALSSATATNPWACFVRGPIVSEGWNVERCVRGKMRGGCPIVCSLVRGKRGISHLIWCWAPVKRTASYARRDRGLAAGYGANIVAGDGVLLLVHGERPETWSPLVTYPSTC
jgi:hypothetical protein